MPGGSNRIQEQHYQQQQEFNIEQGVSPRTPSTLSSLPSPLASSWTPTEMNSPPFSGAMHKPIPLERYPSSKFFSQPHRPRPSNIRLPSISESSYTANAVVNGGDGDSDFPMFPRSITPLPSPPPWKLLFQKAKAREGVDGRGTGAGTGGNGDYFSSRPVQGDVAPVMAPRWFEQHESGLEGRADVDTIESPVSPLSGGVVGGEAQSYDTGMSMDVDMHMDMGGMVEKGGRGPSQLQSHHPPFSTPLSHTEFINVQFQHQVPSKINIPTPATTKRKRTYDPDGIEDDDEVCRRSVKRPMAMASYHRHTHAMYQGLVEAV